MNKETKIRKMSRGKKTFLKVMQFFIDSDWIAINMIWKLGLYGIIRRKS